MLYFKLRSAKIHSLKYREERLGRRLNCSSIEKNALMIIPYAEKTLGRFYLTWGITKTYISLRRLYKLEGKNFDILNGKLYDILLHVGKMWHPIFVYNVFILQRGNLYDVFISCILNLFSISWCVSEDIRYIIYL